MGGECMNNTEKVWTPTSKTSINEPLNCVKPTTFHVYELPRGPSKLNKLWDIMWECPNHQFIIHVRGSRRLKKIEQFVKENAYTLHFGWIPEDRTPFSPGDLIYMDDLWMRDMCGWTANNKCDCNGGYICDHPRYENGNHETCEHGNRLCWSSSCPIAYNDPPREELEKADLAEEYKYDDEGFSIDCDWMQLHTRPRNAFVKNVILVKIER
jgi:hypothetical protein